MVASLIVSVVLLGFKMNGFKRLLQESQRRTELQMALAMLQPKLEEESLATWLEDVDYDRAQRCIDQLALSSGGVYSTMENEAVERCIRMFALFDSNSARATQLPCSATTRRSETKYDEATRLLFGFVEVEIRTTPLEFIAYTLNLDSRFMQSTYAADADVVFSKLLETVNPHHRIRLNRYKARGVSDRTFLYSMIAKQLAEEPPTFFVAVVPIPSHANVDRKDEAGAVRAEAYRSFRLTEPAPGVTKLEYCCSLDLKGWVPQIVSNMVAIPQQMKNPQTAQRYFQQVRPLSECNAEDGRAVGLLLLDLVESKPKDLVHAIGTFVNRTEMLRECGFRHIGSMLVRLLAADGQGAAQGASDDDATIAPLDPSTLTEKQATAIGSTIFLGVRRVGYLPVTALQKVIKSQAALRAMKSGYAWFVPMLEVLTARNAIGPRRSILMKRLSSIFVPNVAPIDLIDGAESVDADIEAEEGGFSSVVRPTRLSMFLVTFPCNSFNL